MVLADHASSSRKNILCGEMFLCSCKSGVVLRLIDDGAFDVFEIGVIRCVRRIYAAVLCGIWVGCTLLWVLELLNYWDLCGRAFPPPLPSEITDPLFCFLFYTMLRCYPPLHAHTATHIYELHAQLLYYVGPQFARGGAHPKNWIKPKSGGGDGCKSPGFRFRRTKYMLRIC